MNRFMLKAKARNGDEWARGYLCKEFGSKEAVYFIENPDTGESARVNPDTVCRPTGLHCRNGEIYEHDIIDMHGTAITVEYSNGGFGYRFPDADGKFYLFGSNPNFEFWEYGKDNGFKIIGNVFD